MKREILANSTAEEVRVAVLEDGRVMDILWERKGVRRIVGNVYKGVVENVLPGISSAFVNVGFEKNAYLYISDVVGGEAHKTPIDSILKKGQEVMVQVVKEAIGTKGMKISMDISLPGRYLVFTPFQDYVGISKQVTDSEERRRLSSVVGHLVETYLGNKGVVVRTEAEGATDNELEREVKYLLRMWESIRKRFDAQPSPCLVHADLDIVLQVARDLICDNVSIYLMDDRKDHRAVFDFVLKTSPEFKDRVRLYEAKTPIFTAFGVDSEIEKLRSSKLQLPNGGTIVIQEAESLCAIDVNTGRYTGLKSQEETVTQTNVEAAQEIARQLRLRNIGGIIVIDFIDMRRASNRYRVLEAFQKATKDDKAKIRILPITRLGLVEMTRERKRESTITLLTEECHQCHGSGRVLSAESMRIKIQQEIRDLTQGRPGGNIRVLLHPLLAETLKSQQAEIERNVHRAISIRSDPQLTWEDYRIILE